MNTEAKCSTQDAGQQMPEFKARTINCDQVAWILAAVSRYLPPSEHPRVSRAREMQKYALLYEIMEAAHLHFQDDAAQHNGTPPDVRRFRYASKQEQCYSEGAAICGAGNPAGIQRMKD